MSRYVVMDEGELSRAANQIKSYADFIARSIEEYIQILAKIQNEKAISDELICAKLSELATQVAPYKSSIYDECEKITKIINDDISAITGEDNFKYPGEWLASISALLAQFL